MRLHRKDACLSALCRVFMSGLCGELRRCRNFQFVLALIASALASPFQLDHQARLTDTSGTPLNGTLALDVEFFDGSGAGAVSLGSDSWTGLSIQGGYVSVVIDADTDWFFSPEVWIEYTVNGTTTLAPRSRLSRVPMAAIATYAEAVPVFDPAVSCTVNGSLRFDETNNALVVCGAGQWREVLTSPVVSLTNGVYSYSDGTSDESCLAYLNGSTAAQRPDGVYSIQPPGYATAFDVWCDMTTDGGGWTVIRSVANASEGNVVSYPSFQRAASVVAGTTSQGRAISTSTGFSLGSVVSGSRKTARFELTTGFTFAEMSGSWVGFGAAGGLHHDDSQSGSSSWLSQSNAGDSSGIVQFGTPSTVVKTGGQYGVNWNGTGVNRTYAFDVSGLSDTVVRWNVIDQSTLEYVDFKEIVLRLR
jgi:hypothetical protein